MVDFPENPRSTLGSAPYHDGISASILQNVFGFFWRRNVTIGNNRNIDSSFDGCNRVVFCIAFVAIGTSAPVECQHLYACCFCHACNVECIFIGTIPAGTKLQCYRHIDCSYDRIKNLSDETFVLQEGGPTPGITHFFDRTTHIDIDDLRTLSTLNLAQLANMTGSAPAICTAFGSISPSWLVRRVDFSVSHSLGFEAAISETA